MNRQQQLDQFSLALHRQAIAALRREPALRERARGTLQRWRAQAGATKSDLLWIEWEQLLDEELPTLERAVLAESDHGTLMRSVSPLGSLIDQHERSALLRQARDKAATP
ncbi:hypothetical protein J7E62_05030 [Variovorax paradoxus]|nr:hypothetical protein [Variovorax paradoxus]